MNKTTKMYHILLTKWLENGILYRYDEIEKREDIRSQRSLSNLYQNRLYIIINDKNWKMAQEIERIRKFFEEKRETSKDSQRI